MTNEQIVSQVKKGVSVTENMQLLYEKNLPLIKKFIHPYIHYESEEDLLQEAYFGLWEAVQHYESAEKVLFMTYAQYWVRQSVQRYIENNSFAIRIPSAYRQKISRYKKAVQELKQDLGRMPTDDEISEYSLLSTSVIQKIKIYMRGVVSLDAPLKEDENSSLSDMVSDDYNLENDTVDRIFNEYQKNEIWNIVERYTDKQQDWIINEYYRKGKTLLQIARETGLSLGKVRQCRDAGIQRLRMSKAQREIKQKFEIVNASVYRTGLNGFKAHGDSIVEYIAVRNVELEESLKRAY